MTQSMTPLQPQLDAIRAGFEPQVPADALAVMHRSNDDLREQASVAVPAGSALPAFELPSVAGTTVRSDDLLAGGPLVVSLFRGAGCPYCTAEMVALNEALPAIRQAGAEVVVITPQRPDLSEKMKADKGLDLNMLWDENLAYAERLGLAWSLPADLLAIYSQFGLDVAGTNGMSEARLPIPARLVVASDGTIVERDVSPDYTIRPEPEATLRDVERIAN